MEKCLWVSKNLFLASEYMFQLIRYKSNFLALNLRSSEYRLKTWVKHDSFTWCLTHTELYYFSKKAQKHVLRLGIDSLRPQSTFPYQNAILRPLEQLWKIIQNHHLDFYCILPSERLQKGSNRVIFGLVFCDFLDSGSWYQKSLLGAKQPPKVLQKTL